MCRPGSPGGHTRKGCLCKCCSRARGTEDAAAGSMRFVVSWTDTGKKRAERLKEGLQYPDVSTVIRRGLLELERTYAAVL